MRGDAEAADDTPGGDSFLDIVANIVGILVLLVVVVGVRAGRQVLEPDAADPPPERQGVEDLEQRVAAATRRAEQRRRDAHELRERIAAAELDEAAREQLREQGALYVTKLRAELDEARAALSEKDRASLDVHHAIAETHHRLEELDAKRVALVTADVEPEVETLEVSPTPIVNAEVDETTSFRLQGGRLVYVPMEEIGDDLRSKMQAPTITDPTRPAVTRHRVGPFEGFVGAAEVVWSVRAIGQRLALQANLGKLVLQEVTPLRGQTPDDAFAPGGVVDSRIGSADPKETVVRLLVYDDSFAEASELKKRFEERGFRVAQSFKRSGEALTFSSDGYSAVTQ